MRRRIRQAKPSERSHPKRGGNRNLIEAARRSGGRRKFWLKRRRLAIGLMGPIPRAGSAETGSVPWLAEGGALCLRLWTLLRGPGTYKRAATRGAPRARSTGPPNETVEVLKRAQRAVRGHHTTGTGHQIHDHRYRWSLRATRPSCRRKAQRQSIFGGHRRTGRATFCQRGRTLVFRLHDAGLRPGPNTLDRAFTGIDTLLLISSRRARRNGVVAPASTNVI